MRVDLGEVSTCAQCGKRFQTLTAFARFPQLEHEKAEIDKFLTPTILLSFIRRPDGRLLHYSCAQLP